MENAALTDKTPGEISTLKQAAGFYRSLRSFSQQCEFLTSQCDVIPAQKLDSTTRWEALFTGPVGISIAVLNWKLRLG